MNNKPVPMTEMDVSPVARATHCMLMARGCTEDITAHSEILEHLAWKLSPKDGEAGIPHPELFKMTDKGEARRKAVREERKIVNALRSQVARLLRDAQMYLCEQQDRDVAKATEVDEALDPMTKRMRAQTAKKAITLSKREKTHGLKELAAIEAAVRSTEPVAEVVEADGG